MKKIKLSWGEIFLLAAPALVFIGIGLHSYRADKLRSSLERIAGTNAVNCSFASITLYSARVRQMAKCQASQWKLKKPFLACDEVAQDGWAMGNFIL